MTIHLSIYENKINIHLSKLYHIFRFVLLHNRNGSFYSPFYKWLYDVLGWLVANVDIDVWQCTIKKRFCFFFQHILFKYLPKRLSLCPDNKSLAISVLFFDKKKIENKFDRQWQNKNETMKKNTFILFSHSLDTIVFTSALHDVSHKKIYCVCIALNRVKDRMITIYANFFFAVVVACTQINSHVDRLRLNGSHH